MLGHLGLQKSALPQKLLQRQNERRKLPLPMPLRYATHLSVASEDMGKRGEEGVWAKTSV